MRAKLLLVICLAMLVGACSSPRVNQPPPPLKKELLPGKWVSTSEDLLIAGYEFTPDGIVKVTVRGMEKPIEARYTWSGDRTVDVDYQLKPEVQEAYKAAVKAYREGIRERIKKGKLPDRAAESIMGTSPDELPANETMHVALSENPAFLMLERGEGNSQTFDRAE